MSYCNHPIGTLTALALAVFATMTLHGAVAQPSSQDAAMLQAAMHGDVPTLSRLIAAGASIDPKDGAGRTPLLIAVAGHHSQAAELLIRAGANINAQAANQDTPWLLAGALGNAQLLRLMVDASPDFSIRNRFGGTALIPACERAHVEAVKVLLSTKINLDHINNLGWTCLLEIVVLGNGGARHVEAAKLVLDAGANPNIADKDGVSPLAHARRQGHHAIARVLEAAGGR